MSYYRIRRIKCDEGKPACHKCTSTGRKCDGYAAPRSSRAGDPLNDAQLSVSPICGLPSDEQGRFYFHHFRQRSILDLVGPLDVDLWQNYILQLAISVPAVQDAVIAFSSLHESYLTCQFDAHAHGHQEPYTGASSMKLYSKALRSLNDIMNDTSNHDATVEITLVSCFLFICFDILRGSGTGALMHLEGGLQLLQERSVAQSNAQHSSATAPNSSLSNLSKLFARLDIQASAYVERRPVKTFTEAVPTSILQTVLGTASTSVSSFDTLLTARDALTNVIGHAYYFLHSTARHCKYIPRLTFGASEPGLHNYTGGPETPSSEAFPDSSCERDHLIQALHSWAQSFENLLKQRSNVSPKKVASSLKDAEARESAVLWLMYLVIFIRLSMCLDPDELSYDNHFIKFKSIVEHAEAVLSLRGNTKLSRAQDSRPPRFTAETSVIAPLYFTALKCRCRSTRQRAVQLLFISGLEGPWCGKFMARIAEYVIFLECEGIPEEDLEREGSDFGIPEYKRVHGASLDVDNIERKVCVQCTKMIPCYNPTEIHWEVYEETLFFDEDSWNKSETEHTQQGNLIVKDFWVLNHSHAVRKTHSPELP